jgi:putative glutamine amidotransferase
MTIVVGITMSFENDIHRLRHAYVDAVERAGAVPVLLPGLERERFAEELCDRLDALVVTGGPAIVDGLVGELPHDLAAPDPRRATFDRWIARAFIAREKPILGICYGMQLLNALDGGTIYADVERQLDGALAHSPKRGGKDHPIEVRDKTHLFATLGIRATTVNTRHLQAVATLGPSFRVSATSPDGVIEAIETDDGSRIGVQFHPERMAMASVFENLISRARR